MPGPNGAPHLSPVSLEAGVAVTGTRGPPKLAHSQTHSLTLTSHGLTNGGGGFSLADALPISLPILRRAIATIGHSLIITGLAGQKKTTSPPRRGQRDRAMKLLGIVRVACQSQGPSTNPKNKILSWREHSTLHGRGSTSRAILCPPPLTLTSL